MNNTNESRKRKIKDPFLQVSESFFEKEEILDIMSRYGYQGIGIYLKISLMLLKNQGKIKYDWKYFSTKKTDKIIVEDIISNSGLFSLDSDGTYFSSYIVDEQLKERGKISLEQTKKVKKRWDDLKSVKTEPRADDLIIIDDAEPNIKPKPKRLSQEEIDEFNRLDGITPKSRKQKIWDEELELNA